MFCCDLDTEVETFPEELSVSVLQEGYLSGKTPFSEVELETCKSSLIFEIIEQEQTPSDASGVSLLSYFRGIPADYNR